MLYFCIAERAKEKGNGLLNITNIREGEGLYQGGWWEYCLTKPEYQLCRWAKVGGINAMNWALSADIPHYFISNEFICQTSKAERIEQKFTYIAKPLTFSVILKRPSVRVI